MNSCCTKYIIEKEQVLEINNKFRSLGLSFKHTGTKLLNKAIQIILSSENEFFVLEDILDELIKIYPSFNKIQIRMAMKYALDHRNEFLSKNNFQKVFYFEYDVTTFETKNFLDEFVYAITNY